MKNKGFSLIELVVVLALLGGLAVATSRIFFSQIRGAEKAQRLLQLRQSGDQAMLTMKKKIRNGREITSVCPGSGEEIEFTSRDPTVTGFASPAVISTKFSCGRPISMKEGDNPSTSLTPEALEVSSCSFECEQATGSPPKVTIEFTLDNGEDELQFKSTVSLRNY